MFPGYLFPSTRPASQFQDQPASAPTSASIATLLSHAHAAASLANAVRSTLGPLGAQKILVDREGRQHSSISGIGSFIASRLKISHPVARLLVESCSSLSSSVHDGTTSMLLLASSLLSNAARLSEQHGLSASQISQGYSLARSSMLKMIPGICLSTEEIKSMLPFSVLHCIAQTCLSSHIFQLGAIAGAHLIRCILVAHQFSSSSSSSNIRFVKRPGSVSCAPSMQALPGLLILAKNMPTFGPSFSSPLENVRVLVCRLDLDVWRTKVASTRVRTSSHEQSADIALYERSKIRSKCQTIVDMGVQAVFNQGLIHYVAEEFFAERNIFCVGSLDVDDLHAIAKACRCPEIISDLDQIRPAAFGFANEIHVVDEMSGAIRVVRSPSDEDEKEAVGACTILLEGPSPSHLDELERAMRSTLHVLSSYSSSSAAVDFYSPPSSSPASDSEPSVYQSSGLVAGGGAAHIELAERLRELGSLRIWSKHALPMYSFADAVESIPLALAQTCGSFMDASDIVQQIKECHRQEEAGEYAGIDCENGGRVCHNTAKELGLLEPSFVLSSVLIAACDAVENILRIDGHVRHEKRETAADMGLLPS